MVQKQAGFRPQIQILLMAEGSQYRGGLGPQRTVALLSPFAKQSGLKRFGQLEITGSQISYLLDTAAGVKHRRQQSVITATLQRGPVDGFENRIDLLVFQVIDGPLSCAFERNAQDSLRQLEMLWIPRRHKMKERVNG